MKKSCVLAPRFSFPLKLICCTAAGAASSFYGLLESIAISL